MRGSPHRQGIGVRFVRRRPLGCAGKINVC
jgi:hypothetical protein